LKDSAKIYRQGGAKFLALHRTPLPWNQMEIMHHRKCNKDMTMTTGMPKIIDDPLYQLLRDGDIDEFNRRKKEGATFDFRGCDFRGLDLRGVDVDSVDFSDCYFRRTDLRGLDLRNATLSGASFAGANVSGAYFPESISAEELGLSLAHGTRVRG
jgi:uncharacterized protein YjbI with pentapeptide repeats